MIGMRATQPFVLVQTSVPLVFLGIGSRLHLLLLESVESAPSFGKVHGDRLSLRPRGRDLGERVASSAVLRRQPSELRIARTLWYAPYLAVFAAPRTQLRTVLG